MDCLFCKIVNKQIKSSIVYENDDVVAFSDINPQAPHHVLIIPRKHIATINDLSSTDAHLYGSMVMAAQHIAKELGVDQRGYRLVNNCNKDAGQTVFHIHMHLIAGRPMGWPPG